MPSNLLILMVIFLNNMIEVAMYFKISGLLTGGHFLSIAYWPPKKKLNPEW